MPANSAAGLAPSAASEFVSSSLKTEIGKPDEVTLTSEVRGKDGEGITELPKEEGGEAGVWINADPLPGCVVCNIGESKCCYLCYEPLGMLMT